MFMGQTILFKTYLTIKINNSFDLNIIFFEKCKICAFETALKF